MSDPPDRSAGGVARSFFALGLGEAVSRLIAFAATVYAARVLDPALYGTIGVAVAVVLYFNRVADLGFELGLGAREIAADPAFLATSVPTVLTFRTLLAAGLAAVVGVGALIVLPEPDGAVIAVQGLTLLAVGIGSRWVHLGFHRAKLAAVAATVGQTLMAVTILALVRRPGDVAIVPTAQVLGDLATAAILLVALRRLAGPLRIRLDTRILRPLLPRSWHLVASALLGIVVFSSGLLFLRGFRGSEPAGHYTAAYTLVTFFINVGIMYNLSLLPTLTRLAGDRTRQHTLYHTALAHVFLVGLPIGIGGALLAGPVVRLVFGPAYDASMAAFGLLVWSIPLNLVRDVPLMGLMAAGDERAVFQVTLAAAVLSVALAAVLVPPFGLPGAAAATLLAEAVRMVLALGFARRRGFPLPGPGRFGRVAVAGAVMGAVLIAVGPGSVWSGVPLGVAGYGAGLWLSGGLKLTLAGWPEIRV